MTDPIVTPGADADRGRLRLRFEHRTAVTTLQDLPPALERWNATLSHFSRVTPGTSPRAVLIDVEGDPLVLDLAVAAAVLAPMQTGLRHLLAALEEVVVLAGKIDELRQLNVRTEILQSLEEQVRDNRQAATARIADGIRTHYQCDQDARNAVHKGLMAIAAFVEDGGQIDIAIDSPTPVQDPAGGHTDPSTIRS